jgi:hypothetical protein
MNKLALFIITGILLTFTQSGCTQANSSATSTSNFIFKSNLRADGTSFYAMDSKNGQLYFMLDYGDTRANWKPYGNKLGASAAGLQFDVLERPGAVTFYALDGRTGQLYFADDDSETGGNWKKYGDTLRENGVSMLQFDASGRLEGNSFYAFDALSGQMYFMNDFGDDAGKWAPYGNVLK